MDRSPSADGGFVAMIEVAEPVQVVQIPRNRSVLAVDLERVEGLPRENLIEP